MSVARQLALVFPGFETMPVEAHCAQFIREAKKNAPVYGMEIAIGAPDFTRQDIGAGAFSVDASGEGWHTATDIVVYGLGDLNEAYSERGPLLRTLTGLAALLDFFFTGTFFKFVATSWRYGLFFLFPVVTFLAAALLALAAGHFLPGGWEFRWVAGVVVFLALLWFASARMHFLLMMDDWTCARDIARGSRPEISERIAGVAADIRSRIGAKNVEEVVLAAHSFGAITAVMALDSVQRSTGEMPQTGLLTVGSSLLKVALHPRAEKLRQAVAAVISGRIDWIDVQSLTDPINFYGSDPQNALGLHKGAGPHILHVRFRNQLSEKTYRAIKYNFFRVHRQFVYAVEKWSAYSFHAILCGPQPFADIAVSGLKKWTKPSTAQPLRP